jgi:calcium/calmodulin-dependent protein kinase I
VYAVKIIRRAKLRASEDEFVMNEVSIMQSLSAYGQYIVQLLDFYEEEHYFYMVMDYMGGGDVFDRVLEKTKFTEKDARNLTNVLLKATRCMHEAGVAHRDLKPQNLLFTVSIGVHGQIVLGSTPSVRLTHSSLSIAVERRRCTH